MGALKKCKCVVLVEEELFEDGAASDDDDPMFHFGHPGLRKLLMQISSQAIIDDLHDKYERDAKNDAHLL